MELAQRITTEKKKYLQLLAKSYPSIRAVSSEIINLQAVLNLPKGTEHFMSDLHGEYEAFYHILNNCSGVIREKVEMVFQNRLSKQEIDDMCTLIYYPQRKLSMNRSMKILTEEWYMNTLYHLIDLCKVVASKYPRSKVREALPKEYSYIIDELLHTQLDDDDNQAAYHRRVLETIVNIGSADDFIVQLSELIKRLAVDRLHIVGDIYDRGPHADKILDMLMLHHHVDVQWGNHDILWMGAASGSETCIATVVKNSVAAGNITFLESGYGISLRPLALFASKTYQELPLQKALLKAIAVILFKLEGQVILRRPEYEMGNRLLLDKMDLKNHTVCIDGKIYPLTDWNFPTLDKQNPYALTAEEENVINHLRDAFHRSERLHRHIRFLYGQGSMYLCCNQNLLFHGCIPLNEDGTFTSVILRGGKVYGKKFLDLSEKLARRAYFGEDESEERQFCRDYMWYLWCGKKSPLFGRSKMTTFERMFVADDEVRKEKKDPYYKWCSSEETCLMILKEFGLCTPYSHIINGHVPVRAVEGESPIKGGGRLIVIDGGFCRAYQHTTGIAGYTLIYNSHGMRILSHQPFIGIEQALKNNEDIQSHSQVFETELSRVMVLDTDEGEEISNRIYDLTLLLGAYRQGILTPKN